VVAERPKLNPHIEAMRAAIVARLGVSPEQVGVKATHKRGAGADRSPGGGASLAMPYRPFAANHEQGPCVIGLAALFLVVCWALGWAWALSGDCPWPSSLLSCRSDAMKVVEVLRLKGPAEQRGCLAGRAESAELATPAAPAKLGLPGPAAFWGCPNARKGVLLIGWARPRRLAGRSQRKKMWRWAEAALKPTPAVCSGSQRRRPPQAEARSSQEGGDA